jgi:hypothetical protein
MRGTVSAYKRQIRCDCHTLSGHWENEKAMTYKAETQTWPRTVSEPRAPLLKKTNNLLIAYR